MSETPSLLLCYGLQYYKLHELIYEAETQGLSKRVPITSIPEGMEHIKSKLFVAHPHAIVKVTEEDQTLQDLAYDLYEQGFLSEKEWNALVELEVPYWDGQELEADDFVPASMLDVAIALSKVDTRQKNKMIKKYGIEFCQGIVGYSYFTGFQYIVKEGEDGLPDELANLDGYVEAVRPVYVDKDGKELD